MKTTANNPQSSTHSKQTSIKLRWSRLILALAALWCALSGLSRVQAESIEDPSELAIFSNKDGALPYAGLILYNGNLYGTTVSGGANGMGEIFRVSPTGGNPVTLWSFKNSSTDGAYPYGTLVQLSGKFYGTASAGGAYGCGSVFVFTPPSTSGGEGTMTTNA